MSVLLIALMSVIIPFAAATAVKTVQPDSIDKIVTEQYNEPIVEKHTKPPADITETQHNTLPEAKQERGFLVLDRATGEVMQLSAEEYIRGAVASEMPASFHQQALNAQGVAAHTWAIYSSEMQKISADESLSGADFSVDSEKCEGYMTQKRFFERYGSSAQMLWPKICAAADYAVERIVVFEGEPALTAYHSTSVGMTESSDNVWEEALPYLVPVESEGDMLAPGYSTTETYDQKTMKLLLEQSFPDAELSEDSPQSWINIKEVSPSGYIMLADVGGQEVHGQQVRNSLKLRSSCFEIKYASGTFTVITKGYGHGVGMSQYGADFMARQGSTAQQILEHYYPETEIAMVSE